MPRKGYPQINITYPIGSTVVSELEEIATSRRRQSKTTVASIFVEDRLELHKAGWRIDDQDTAALLALCISRSNPPSGGTLAQLRAYALAQGAEPGGEDLWLKEHNIVPDTLRLGLSLLHAGLDLHNKDGLETLLNVAHNPHLLAAVRILTKMPEERLLQTVDAMESAAAAG